MSKLAVTFDVPDYIKSGLAKGVLQRIGGVIVDASSKQVVAWLRDSSVVETAVENGLDLAASIPSPLAIIMQAARVAVSLIDGHFTRQAVEGVSQQVEAVSQQMSIVNQTVTAFGAFTATGQVLNLAITATSLYVTMKRLDKLTEEVSKLNEVIRSEFTYERDMRFKRALQAARDAFESSNKDYRDTAASNAIDGLFEARENFLAQFEKTLNGDLNHDKLLIAQHYLIRALYAETSRIRCYMISNDVELAKRRLAEAIPHFMQCTQLLVRKWLGNHPALFFHKDVSPVEMDRFFQIQQWLYTCDGELSSQQAMVMFNILNDVRGDFWNISIIQDEYDNVFNQILKKPVKAFNTRITEIPKVLTQAEVIIENYQRLLGFELELRSMRLSLQEWQHLIAEDELQKQGMGIILDLEAAEFLHPWLQAN